MFSRFVAPSATELHTKNNANVHPFSAELSHLTTETTI